MLVPLQPSFCTYTQGNKSFGSVQRRLKGEQNVDSRGKGNKGEVGGRGVLEGLKKNLEKPGGGKEGGGMGWGKG